MVFQKERVVALRRHGYTDLTQVVQVLQHGGLQQHITHILAEYTENTVRSSIILLAGSIIHICCSSKHCD